MSPRDETARRLFRQGDFVSLLKEYSGTAEGAWVADRDARLTVAHAAAITGNLPLARRLADISRYRDATLEDRARSELVLGVSAERTGDLSVARDHYVRGIGVLAHEDPSALFAWLHLHRFRLALEGDSKESLTGEVTRLRRLAIRVGDPQVTAYLHMCIAVFEGETGSTIEAFRHSWMAASLLESADSSALRSANLVNLGCLAILSGRPRDASTYLAEAQVLLRSTGDPSLLRGSPAILLT
jgi:hypothetical protein